MAMTILESLKNKFKTTSFPLVRQFDSMQCGIACMAMVSMFYGEDYSLRFLERKCIPSREGVSLKALYHLGETLGYKCRASRLSADSLSSITLPVILHWNNNHFVVLYKIDNGRYFISDPAKGKRVFRCDDFKSHWIKNGDFSDSRGIGLILSPTEKFGSIKDDLAHHNVSWDAVTSHFKRFRKNFIRIALCLLVIAAIQFGFPFLTQAIVDKGIRFSNPNFIILILIGQLFMVMGRMGSNIVKNRIILRMTQTINVSMISDFFIKLLGLPMHYFDTKLSGDLMQRMGDHGRIQSFLTDDVLGVTFSIFSFVVFSIVLIFYDFQIFLVYMAGCFLYSIWIILFLRRRRELDFELFDKSAACQGKTMQFISSIQEIKLQNCEYRRTEEWKDAQNSYFNIRKQIQDNNQIMDAGRAFINESKNLIITFMAAIAVINSDLTLGGMLAIQYIVGQLNSPVEQLASFVYSLQYVKISMERIQEISEAEKEDGEKRNVVLKTPVRLPIYLNNVFFKYDLNSSKEILKGICAVIEPGKITAIVGPSGSGKTTILKLILGFYPLLSGKIHIGDFSLENVNLKEWRKRCGVVMQDGVIFSDTIARNIATVDGNINLDKLEKAARAANIYDFIMSLPLKFDTIIGNDGIGLSQGQKQRLLIARVIYREPDYIFLDEATNSLDAKNEMEIVSNLNKFYQGKTVIVVAHRLSTVRNADNILVIDNGLITEAGNHNSLVSNGGTYFSLVKSQLELGA